MLPPKKLLSGDTNSWGWSQCGKTIFCFFSSHPNFSEGKCFAFRPPVSWSRERLVPPNPSLNFPELRRFSLEAHGDCRASLEKVKHPSGFPDLPSQVMFRVSYSPPHPPCKHVNCTEDMGGLAFFSGRFKQQLFFSDTISFALGTRMFQRTEEWGWAARKKNKMYLTKLTSLCSRVPQPPLLSCTVLIFHHRACEKKTARSFRVWIIQPLSKLGDPNYTNLSCRVVVYAE